VTSIDNSYLLGLYSGGANLAGTAAGGASQSALSSTLVQSTAVKKAPSAPWRQTEVADSELVKAALNGRRFIDESAAKLDVRGASDDYRKLFALYRGLNTLEALATRMGERKVGEFEKSQIRRVFEKGLAEVKAYAGQLELDGARLTQGAALTRNQSLVGMKRTDTVYEGTLIHSGNSNDPVAAFQGTVKFSLSAKQVNSTVNVSFDLDEMGATPRTMANVLSYMNGKLEAAGLKSRFATERVSGTAKPITVGGKTVTLPDKADSWRLNLKGDLGETLTFSAPATAEAVYVAQTAGKPQSETKTSTGTTTVASTLNSQLLKFQSDVSATVEAPPAPMTLPGDQNWVAGRAFSSKMGEGVGTVHASVAGADGSIYVVADAIDTVAGQTIKGDQDVALFKYDSAGHLVWSRTLGAAETATGYALAVAADGKVAVAGSVTGVLVPGDDGLDGKKADSFVTLFDDKGDEMWTQRRAARMEDEATAVGFGADGTVYVAGRARSTMPGADGSIGSWDSYLQAFTTVAGPVAYAPGLGDTLIKTPTWKGQPQFTIQYGTTGADKPAGLVVSGSSVYLAGVEDGNAVVRKYDLQGSADPVLAATRNLGQIQGSIAGLAVDGTSVVLAGTTTNGGLAAGTPTHAHSGLGSDAFAARLALDLQAGAGDRLAYYGGAGADTAAAVAISGGKVWITGSTTGDLPGLAVQGTGTKPKDGYLARLDLDTGAADWSRRFTSTDQQVAPASIAVVAGGASVLDRFGLPNGTIQHRDSRLITAGTSVRAGDQFFIRPSEGGPKVGVTISATDTLQTLAAKVKRAAGFAAKVEVQKKGGYDTLKITPLNDRASIEVLAGTTGKNALAALGLTEGVVSNAALAGASGDLERVFGLGLTEQLSLETPEKAAHALKFVQMAISTVKNAYNYIANPNLFSGDGDAKTSGKTGGTPPAYLTNQISNYQAALARLGG
jgi:hypothetical protein